MASLASSTVFVTEGTPPKSAILSGDLCKKSKYKGIWKSRRFDLLRNEDGTLQMSYFDPSTNASLGTVDLSTGVMVRILNSCDGSRCELQIRDATEKVFLLRAHNQETRDTWCHRILRLLTGSSGAPSNHFNGNSTVVFAGGVRTVLDGNRKTDKIVEVEIDAIVPGSYDCKRTSGNSFVLGLDDGRVLNVDVPVGSQCGDVVRARIREMAPSRGGPTAKKGVSALVACAEDWLNRSNVPIVVPCCTDPKHPWQSHDVAGRGGGNSTTQDFGDRNPSTVVSSLPLPTQAAEQGSNSSKKYEDTISTGKYDLAELENLCKMEDDFRLALANLWGVEDEESLPDTLQDFDFSDILESGKTVHERGAFLFRKFLGAEGYRVEMEDDAKALIEKTVGSF
mmetsp:Transcript_66698/g.134443  ORF Transcript_66698/g.134443 Transcript_66698/m.134443 type:complete len:395 (+) Transcript_66698:96-1280(+)